MPDQPTPYTELADMLANLPLLVREARRARHLTQRAAGEARKRYERARKVRAVRPGECGAVSPRDNSQWCRQPEEHTCSHSPVASPPGMCGVLLNPPDPYTYCRLPAGHDWGVECTQNVEEQP